MTLMKKYFKGMAFPYATSRHISINNDQCQSTNDKSTPNYQCQNTNLLLMELRIGHWIFICHSDLDIFHSRLNKLSHNMPKIYLYLIILLSTLFSGLTAQVSEPSRDDHLIIQLVTIDPGDELTMWWGHMGIIVHDKRFNAGMFYNYGLFSFNKENFVMNFIRGRLIFWVGGFNSERALNFYQNQNRTIRIQTLKVGLLL